MAEPCHMAKGCQTNPERLAGSTSNMANAWAEDLKLREDMKRYVGQGYKREEVLDFLKWDFPMYAWSIRSLGRRLRSFKIYCNNRPNWLTQYCTQLKPFGKKRFVSGISISFKCECHILMQMQHTKNLNPGRFELGTTLS